MKQAMRLSPGERRHAVPIVRFIGVFLTGFMAFQLVYYEWVVPSAPFEAYLAGSARVAAGILRGIGMDAVAIGSTLAGRFDMSISVGCDGVQVMAILVIAVLAFPVSWRTKLVGVGSGIGVLLVLNTLRIVTLYCAGATMPKYFQLLHVHVWPTVLIVLAFAMWFSWAIWATPANRHAGS
jgi:exosortase/archaeosortase family protein